MPGLGGSRSECQSPATRPGYHGAVATGPFDRDSAPRYLHMREPRQNGAMTLRKVE